MFVAFLVERWNQELSPWNALPVFGQESFGEGAGETLRFISEKLIPLTTEEYASGSNLPVILGGYSLRDYLRCGVPVRQRSFLR